MDISPKRSSLMETVWEMERSCPNRRQESATMTEFQRRILAKIESLESTDSFQADTGRLHRHSGKELGFDLQNRSFNLFGSSMWKEQCAMYMLGCFIGRNGKFR